jgi:pimeloyl-ACP methyl ester carboxylesterase
VQEIAVELHALLLTAAAPGPYVLVGHSFGGFVARVFAHRYPDEVVGMVLVDVPHPEYPWRALQLMPPAAVDECEELRESRAYFTQLVQGSDDPETHPEGVQFGISLSQVAATGTLGAMPLVVLTAGRIEPYPPDFPPELGAQLDHLRAAQQRELARLSSAGQHIIATRSGHMIQGDEPELVVEAIHRVVEAARHQ